MRGGNPLRILSVLDRHLVGPCELTVYGRSALALGYPGAPEVFFATLDVDAILPARDLSVIEANEDFWSAQPRKRSPNQPRITQIGTDQGVGSGIRSGDPFPRWVSARMGSSLCYL